LEKIEFLNNLKYTWSGHHNLQLHIKKDKQIKNQSFILSKRLKKSLQEKKKKKRLTTEMPPVSAARAAFSASSALSKYENIQ
jgi:hypothetical protein